MTCMGMENEYLYGYYGGWLCMLGRIDKHEGHMVLKRKMICMRGGMGSDKWCMVIWLWRLMLEWFGMGFKFNGKDFGRDGLWRFLWLYMAMHRWGISWFCYRPASSTHPFGLVNKEICIFGRRHHLSQPFYLVMFLVWMNGAQISNS